MAVSPPAASGPGVDPGDPDGRVALAVPLTAGVVLAPLELDDDDLATPADLHHLPDHPGPRQGARLDDGVPVPMEVRDLRELDGRALLGRQPLEPDHLALADPVLLAARHDHGLHDDTSSCWTPGKSRTPRAGSHNWTTRPGPMSTHGRARIESRRAPTGRCQARRPKYSASRWRRKRRERWIRDFTAGRLMPSSSAISGLGRPSMSWSTRSEERRGG